MLQIFHGDHDWSTTTHHLPYEIEEALAKINYENWALATSQPIRLKFKEYNEENPYFYDQIAYEKIFQEVTTFKKSHKGRYKTRNRAGIHRHYFNFYYDDPYYET